MGKDLLVEGAIIHLWSKESGKCLRIGDGGNADATGRCGEYAKFIVHGKPDGDVCLQNVKNNNHWMAIRGGEVKGDGTGGIYTHFFPVDHGPGFISLESKEARGQYIGSNDKGDLMVENKTNNRTKFYVIPVQPASGQTIPPSSRHLNDGAEVRLWSCAYGMNVRIQQDGAIDGKGWSGKYVHKESKDVVKLQNVQNPDHWISIKKDDTTGIAKGGKFTKLSVHDAENGMVCFEAVEHPGQHLGVLPNGDLKPPTETGKGTHGQFHVLLC